MKTLMQKLKGRNHPFPLIHIFKEGQTKLRPCLFPVLKFKTLKSTVIVDRS